MNTTSWGVDLPFLIDREQASQRAAGVADSPATVVLDAQHNIRWVAPVNAAAEDVIAAVGREREASPRQATSVRS